MKTCFNPSAAASAHSADQLHKDLQVFQARALHIERELQRTKVAHAPPQPPRDRAVRARGRAGGAPRAIPIFPAAQWVTRAFMRSQAKRFLSSQLMQILEASEVRKYGKLKNALRMPGS